MFLKFSTFFEKKRKRSPKIRVIPSVRGNSSTKGDGLMKTAHKAGEILRLFEKTFDQMMAYTVQYVDSREAENLCHEAYIALLNENEGRYIDENRLPGAPKVTYKNS